MRILFAIGFTCLAAPVVVAQQIIPATVNDSVRVTLPAVRGTIQWQSSPNGAVWTNVLQQTSNVLKYKIASMPVYLRAQIQDGTCEPVYSSFLSFEQATSLPQVTTASVSQVSAYTASAGGNVTNDGGGAITARGVVYGTSPNPTLSNSVANGGVGTGAFTANLSGLTSSTQYYVRAFATNSLGTAYGNEQMFTTSTIDPATTILMFVSHDSTYYSEYIVMRKALEASGFTVDVRSSASGQALLYMSPSNTTIDATAATLPGGSYAQFTQQFQNMFGAAWDPALNSYATLTTVDGRIQDVPNMNTYRALVVVGGKGALQYRVDGTYSSQVNGVRQVSAADVQSASEKLNQLALDALSNGKPVMAQCHGASIPVFWRIPATSGTGAETIGFSLLKNQSATGFPEAATTTTLSALGVTHRTNDRVTISSPHSSFNDSGNGDFKIITTRDWYPQTVAHAARTLVNVLQTHVPVSAQSTSTSVLILHGGAVDPSNCGPANRANDVPCNHGTGANLPADYTDLQNLLNANSPNDDYSFQVTSLNLTGSLPFNNTNSTEVLNYLNQFDVVLFFKHWSTGVTAALQNAMVSYADGGGNILALHHGLYNDIDGALNKNIIVNQLFGAESAQSGWAASLTNYHLFSTNYGHFISTYGISLTNASESPAPWNSNSLSSAANTSYSFYHNLDIYDELYNNMTFIAGHTFGRGVDQINPIFSNDLNIPSQCHTSGFVKRFNPSGDASEGKLAYFIGGERKESININHRYGQVIRNALIWLAK
jgi:putative intracellular protease/amidase